MDISVNAKGGLSVSSPNGLSPLVHCLQAKDLTGSDGMTTTTSSVDCHGMVGGHYWFNNSTMITMFIVSLTAIALSLLLNLSVLWLLHAGRIKLSELGVIIICSNTVSDFFLTLNVFVNDVVVPLIPDEEVFGPSDTAPALFCRFRTYISHVCLTMDLLTIITVVLFVRDKVYERLFSRAPCGIFIFPSLLAFVSLSVNIWSLVLNECRMVSVSYNSKFYTAISVLISRTSYVGHSLFAQTLITQCLPPVFGFCALIRASRQKDFGDKKIIQRLILATCLLFAHLLAIPHTLVPSTLALMSPANQKLDARLLVASIVSHFAILLMLLLKPVFYLALQPNIRKAFLESFSRGFTSRRRSSAATTTVTKSFVGADYVALSSVAQPDIVSSSAQAERENKANSLLVPNRRLTDDAQSATSSVSFKCDYTEEDE